MAQAQIVIVAQNLLRLIQTPTARRVTLALALPFAGIMAAFGIAPDTVTEDITRRTVVEAVALQPALLAPAKGDVSSQSNLFVREETVRRGETLPSLLARLEVDDPDAIAYLRKSPEARPLFNLSPGRGVRVQIDGDSRLQSLRYLNGNNLLTATREGDGFEVTSAEVKLESRVLSATGEIRSSLFATTDAINLPDPVAVQIAEIFSTDIDFHKDLRKGDRFSVIYEMFYDRGEPVRSGRVLSAEFVNNGKTLHAAWFEHGGDGAYYTLDGRDLRKAFLRSPLEFSRVTSGFTHARFHPILRSWTAHKGVDYAAPMGTRIKATADGVVEFAGVQNGYGNVVILRHQSKYTTLYAHMQGFAGGIQKGARVAQGDVIGYIGMTGLTTGPHVHYEFRINDVHHDPLSVAMPQAFPITPERKPAFDKATRPLAERLALMRGTSASNFE
jgi:murein DD-endopeptidase MepM/ murein hydrolase activator NlpD